jgi:hypothetical protein
LNFLANNGTQSREKFTLVSQILDEDAAKTKFRLIQGGANAVSSISSDDVIAYKISSYEQTMLHTYQALNYLFLGELEGAL